MPNDCSQKMSQYITVCVVHSSVLAWISSVHIDKVIAWLRFRKICVLKASFSKNLLQIQGCSWIFVTGRHYRDCRRHESCRGFWGYSPPPPQIFKFRGSELLFSVLAMRYVSEKSTSNKCFFLRSY